jgi:hypothetical protein
LVPRLDGSAGSGKESDAVNQPDNRPTSVLLRDLLLAALRVRNERLNALAIELFGRTGEEAVRRLILEAGYSKNSRAYRLRILRAIQRIGVVSNPDDMLNLIGILNDKDEVVRDVVGTIISSMRHGTIAAV